MYLTQLPAQRLVIRHWDDELADPAGRARIERALEGLLSPEGLAAMPAEMQLDQSRTALRAWVESRAQERDVYLITISTPEQGSGRLVGLMFLVDLADEGAVAQMQLGYLLSEQDWGQGYAFEMMRGMLEILREVEPVAVLAGVGRDNPASAKLLEQAGFTRDTGLSGDGACMFVRSFA
ncbi:GNAT family N-acetyltransferase [Aliiroseovarius crassostreae]|uniref:GNAT family N-acetyltransferase n=1 Tax=Aliiroseovarius crassostreae TaxID=154981 RepID=UPI0022024D88|nr:GNAT family N-acetyltransferase [Aliiroseovarius crassostreae]UWQ11260.1 GNAT family N-acetyltransferase [Aliiroseovarius crassostreae]